MSAKTKLELTWIGKGHRPRLEPRILIEDEGLSHHATARRENDIFDNILIHGDNLLALKALEASHVGTVKCVYIVIAHPVSASGSTGSFAVSTNRRTLSTDARLAFAVLTRERKAA
jgi:hypothetical protein